MKRVVIGCFFCLFEENLEDYVGQVLDFVGWGFIGMCCFQCFDVGVDEFVGYYQFYFLFCYVFDLVDLVQVGLVIVQGLELVLVKGLLVVIVVCFDVFVICGEYCLFDDIQMVFRYIEIQFVYCFFCMN